MAPLTVCAFEHLVRERSRMRSTGLDSVSLLLFILAIKPIAVARKRFTIVTLMGYLTMTLMGS